MQDGTENIPNTPGQNWGGGLFFFLKFRRGHFGVLGDNVISHYKETVAFGCGGGGSFEMAGDRFK